MFSWWFKLLFYDSRIIKCFKTNFFILKKLVKFFAVFQIFPWNLIKNGQCS
jgi:hypothetical protein